MKKHDAYCPARVFSEKHKPCIEQKKLLKIIETPLYKKHTKKCQNQLGNYYKKHPVNIKTLTSTKKLKKLGDDAAKMFKSCNYTMKKSKEWKKRYGKTWEKQFNTCFKDTLDDNNLPPCTLNDYMEHSGAKIKHEK
jgi:hypothetical protein